MKKTLGNYRKVAEAVFKKTTLSSFGIQTGNKCVNSINALVVSTLPNETVLPKEAEKHLHDLEIMSKDAL